MTRTTWTSSYHGVRRRCEWPAWLALAALTAIPAIGAVLGMGVALTLLLGCVAAYFSLRSFATAVGLLLFASAGLSYGVILDYRIQTRGVLTTQLPISLLDAILFLTVLSFLIHILVGTKRAVLPAYLSLPLWLYASAVAIGVIVGLANHNSVYVLLKELRLHIAFLVSLVGTALFAADRRTVRVLFTLLCTAAVSVSAQQFSLLARLASGAVVTQVRDVRIPAQVLPLAIGFLILHSMAGSRRTLDPLTMGIHILWALAAVLSLTRSVWIQLAMTYVLVLTAVGSKRRAKAVASIAPVLPLIVASGYLADALLSSSGSLQALVAERLLALTQSQMDYSHVARVLEVQAAWSKWLTSPLLGYGLGAEILAYDPAVGALTPRSFLHNSVMEYAVKTGILGLLAAAYLYAAGIRGALRMRFLRTDELSVYSTAVACGLIPFVLVGIWSGNLQHIGFAPMLGLLLGLNWPAMAAEEPSA